MTVEAAAVALAIAAVGSAVVVKLPPVWPWRLWWPVFCYVSVVGLLAGLVQ